MHAFTVLLITFLLYCFSTPVPPSVHYAFSLEQIAAGFPDSVVRLEKTEGQLSLQFKPDAPDRYLPIDDRGVPAWETAKYLVLEVEHDLSYSAILYLDFFRLEDEAKSVNDQGGDRGGRQPRLSAKIGVLPGLPTQVVFPLEHLNGQEIFLRRMPRQLKGTVLGSRIAPSDIARMGMRLGPFQKPGFQPAIKIHSIRLTDVLPAPLPGPAAPAVDSFGQWTARNWPGKVHSKTALIGQLTSLREAAEEVDYPEGWSRYGGWKGKRFEASGYFRTHNDGRRWWLVDPEGYAFLSMGMDCIGASATGVLEGQEDLFQALPPRKDPLYKGAYGSSRGLQTVDFYKYNLMRTFGRDWEEQWQQLTAGMLRDMRFNTVGNWSDLDFARSVRMPYVLPLSNFPATETLLFRDFPDVFDKSYREAAESFAGQLEAYREDPYLIGYFLRNEPHWAFGFHNLAFEMFAEAKPSATRRAFSQWIAERYDHDIGAFNRAWQFSLPAFQALDTLTFTAMPSAAAEQDLYAFSERMVQEYVGVVCDAVEAIDSNHLNLGMRYAWISSDLLYKAGERFDVFSINGYRYPAPPPTDEIARRSGKPVLIGEFHFGAVDAGLPSTGIEGVKDQEARGTAYRHYVEQGFARPEVIGLHYFQWNDQPVFGRFDGENYNIGFLDICLRPYAPLQRAARRSHERMYRVAEGEIAAYDTLAPRIPQIFF